MDIIPTCKPWQGRPHRYQDEVWDLWMHYHDLPLPTLSYLAPSCETEMCTEVEHLQVLTIRHLDYPKGICVYCGNPAGTKDHILPKTWTGEAARSGVLTVPACGECNSAISDTYAPTITLRRQIAHSYIRKRYRKTLNAVIPTREELDEYGPGLRSYMADAIVEHQLVLDRLSWPPLGYDERYIERSGYDAQASGLIHPYED